MEYVIPVLNHELLTQIGGDILHSPMLYLIIALISLEFMTGMGKAFITGTYSSKIGLNGTIRQAMVLSFIIVLKFFGRVFGLTAVTTGFVSIFAFNYVVSIIENLEASGVDFPEIVKTKFLQMKKKQENEIVIDLEDDIILRKNVGKKGVDR